MKNIVVGTAGHIDHGKSALIKALTGTDPDRLKEEKERGITIDLGFAGLNLTKEVLVSFIDVPGHEKFIKNMLAGVGGIDAVLLVVAANESIMPQTREHFDICRLLKISQGIVVITKCDLVDKDMMELVSLEIKEYLKGSFLETAPVIPFSCLEPEKIQFVKRALIKIADSVPVKSLDLPLRLPVDRCFGLKGFGTIVTGTLVSGSIKRNTQVQLYPSSKKSRIRQIHVHSKEVVQALPGQRTALNLKDLEVGEIQRGMQISNCNRYQVISVIEGQVTLLQSSPVIMKNRKRVRFHLGSVELLGTLIPIKPRQISAGETGWVRLILERPVLGLVGDRFILRRASPMTTIGGGIILDIFPPSQNRKRDVEQRVQFLQKMGSENNELIVEQLAKRESANGIKEDRILAQVPLSKDLLHKVLSEMIFDGRLRKLGNDPLHIIHKDCFTRLSDQSLNYIRDYQRREPLSSGISREQLNSSIFAKIHPAVFKEVLAHLSEQHLIDLEQDRVRLRGKGLELNKTEEKALREIEEIFVNRGLMVPTIEEVFISITIPRENTKKLIAFLIRQKKLVKVTENLFFHVKSIEELKKKLTNYKQENSQIDVRDFKELTGLSRKYAIPLLEYLDRERITRRTGDLRLIN